MLYKALVSNVVVDGKRYGPGQSFRADRVPDLYKRNAWVVAVEEQPAPVVTASLTGQLVPDNKMIVTEEIKKKRGRPKK